MEASGVVPSTSSSLTCPFGYIKVSRPGSLHLACSFHLLSTLLHLALCKSWPVCSLCCMPPALGALTPQLSARS